jgi:large subunit ribosomal protein L21e
MVKSSKGSRSRTRGVLTKEARDRGMPPVTRYLQAFEVGQKVVVRLEASEHRGQPHPRYQGQTATVLRRVGRAYQLEFYDGGKRKELVALPVHLAPAGGGPPKKE